MGAGQQASDRDGTGPEVRARLTHRSPGRLRVRVDPEQRAPERMEQLRVGLSSNPDVGAVHVNPRSGSVLVTGPDTERLWEALQNLMMVIQEAGPERAPELGVQATVAAINELDGRLAAFTNGRVRLRALVPAAFITLGIRQLIAEGLTLGSVPWYVLIYYGVDSFLKLYPEHAPKAPPGAGLTGQP
jgi:hypothetical protein